MMQTMQPQNAGDPEMQQLNGMLEKILDIQHPQRVREKLRQTSQADKGKVFAVKAKGNNDPVSFLTGRQSGGRKEGRQPGPAGSLNGFYSLQEEKEADHAIPNAIAAVVHETQTVFEGAVIKLRLTGDVSVNGILIPKASFVYGIASLDGERLNIKISNIRLGNSLFPVELSVYDLDGLAGIYIPGAITRDVARHSADRAIQDIRITTLDPSLEVQAATAGVEAAKSLFSKKTKLVKVTVKAGYQVLLRDEKQL
jgi:conjugative transposon TraM protein